MVDRALLLTDLVDSTLLTERLGDAAMARLLADHDRFARDLLPRFHGREIDKSDGFLLLFDDATNAAQYAIAYHDGLRALGLSARAGLHVGPVVLRENPAADVARGAKPLEVDGIAKSIAARVMATAMGGQTLVSAAAAKGVAAGRLVSHGHWHMKGIAEPVELFEIGDERAPFSPPPDAPKSYRVVFRDEAWVPVRDVPHLLPAELDRFVARDGDLQELSRRFDEGARLVSVIGTGGSGKTRLAIRFARTRLGEWPGGAWFCDLAQARTTGDVVAAVARTLDVPVDSERIGHALAGRGPCLVVLDNFEQVTASASETVGAWLARAPAAQFLVTSRELLGLPGETVLDLSPLSVDASIDLFLARARAAHRGFKDPDRAQVEALVRMLDGLPLAIELAAARAGMLSTQQIYDRMRDRFALLISTRGRPDRHATLRAAIDGSWDLLRPAERSALAQLSVFEGGFTIDDACAVLDLTTTPGGSELESIQALVDKSLVRRLSDESLGVLVSIQEYASEKLEASNTFPGSGPQAVNAAEARHAKHFATLGTPEALDALATGGVSARRRYAAELANIVAACKRSVARGDGSTAVPLLAAAREVTFHEGSNVEGVALAEAVCGMPSLDAAELAAASVLAGHACFYAGRLEASRAHFERALHSQDPRVRGRALLLTGMIEKARGRYDEARVICESALSLSRATGDRFFECRCHNTYGLLLRDRGEREQARQHFEATLSLARELGERRAEGGALNNLALLSNDALDWEQAERLTVLALAVHRELGNQQWEAVTLGNLAAILSELGRLEEAEHHCLDAVDLCQQRGDRRGAAGVLTALSTVLDRRGHGPEARRKAQQAIAILRELDRAMLLQAILADVQAAFHLGDVPSAREGLEEAEAIAASLGIGPDSPYWRPLTKLRELLAEAPA